MKHIFFILMTALLSSSAIAQMPSNNAPQPTNNGLRPVPFYGSLRTDDAKLRSLPHIDARDIREMGSRASYSVHGHGLPIQVLDRQADWRFIVNAKGDHGWVPVHYVSTARTFEIIGTEPASLRRNPSDDASVVATLEPGTPGRLLSCPSASNWCQVRSFNRRGFVRRDQMWGLSDGEVLVR